MRSRFQSNHHRARRHGLSLIEVLVSLSITAMLLVAVGAAFYAATAAVRENDQIFRASQAARISLAQIMGEVRKSATEGSISGSGTSLQLNIAGTDGTGDQSVTYSFDSTNNTLTQTRVAADGSLKTGILAHNIGSVSFDTDANQQTISMMVVVQIDSNQFLLNGSAMPRRLIKYQ